jgi:hypothetical protein
MIFGLKICHLANLIGPVVDSPEMRFGQTWAGQKMKY